MCKEWMPVEVTVYSSITLLGEKTTVLKSVGEFEQMRRGIKSEETAPAFWARPREAPVWDPNPAGYHSSFRFSADAHSVAHAGDRWRTCG